MFSFAWSVHLGSTLNISRGLFRTFMFGAYFATRYSLKDQMKILAWVFGIVAILSLASVLAIPSYGLSYAHSGAWKGIFLHKSSLGYTMAIGSILFLFTAIKDRKPNWLAWSGFILAVGLVLKAEASAGLICLLGLLSLMPIYQVIKQHYKLKTILLSFACILAGGTSMLILGNLETILVDILEQSTTGRISIWTLIIDSVLEERPWLGYGFNAFWSSDAAVFVSRYAWSSTTELNNAHSSYVDLFSDLGLLGISLGAISLVTVFMRVLILLVATKKIEFFWLLQFLVFTAVAAFADVFVSILGVSTYGTIYVSICLSTAVELKQIRVNKKHDIGAEINKTNSHYLSKSKVSR